MDSRIVFRLRQIGKKEPNQSLNIFLSNMRDCVIKEVWNCIPTLTDSSNAMRSASSSETLWNRSRPRWRRTSNYNISIAGALFRWWIHEDNGEDWILDLKSECWTHLRDTFFRKLERDHIVSHVMAKDSSNFVIVLSGRNIKSHLIVLFNGGVCWRDKRLQNVWTSVQNVFSHCIKAETENKKNKKTRREGERVAK